MRQQATVIVKEPEIVEERSEGLRIIRNAYCYNCAEKYGLERRAPVVKTVCCLCHQEDYCCTSHFARFDKGALIYAPDDSAILMKTFDCHQYPGDYIISSF